MILNYNHGEGCLKFDCDNSLTWMIDINLNEFKMELGISEIREQI